MKQNKKSSKVLFGLISSSIFAIPFTAISCRCEKEKHPDNNITLEKDHQIGKELNKLKAKLSPKINKANTSASSIEKKDISFYNYDQTKYEINSVSLDKSQSDLGILKLKVSLKSKKNPKIISRERTITIEGFKKKTNPEPNDPNKIYNTKSNNFIDKNSKIKYLSIGDSISAGFTGLLDQDYHGSLKNGKVNGMSFAAYLASLLNNEKGRLEEFDNFAASNATALEWLDLLGVNYESTNSLFKNSDSLYKTTFNRFGNLDEFKKLLIKKIKEANLMTMTIGANDFLRMISSLLQASNFNKLINELMLKGSLDQNTLIKFALDFINVAQEEIKARVLKLIERIKEINPNVNLSLVSYPTPILRFVSSIIEFLSDNIKQQFKNFNIPELLIDQLNNAIKDAVSQANIKKLNVGYLDTFDAEFWNKNQQKLASMVFDIHPTIYGYKKMAWDAYLKLTNGEIDRRNLSRFGWSNHYINKNANTHFHTVELRDDPTEVYKKLFGNEKDEALKNLLSEDELYKSIKSQISNANFAKRLTNFPTDMLNEIAISMFIKYLGSSLIREFDPNETLLNFFKSSNYASVKALVKWFKSSKWFKEQLTKAQKLADEKDWDNDGLAGVAFLKKEYILEIFRETFFKPESLLSLTKEILDSDFSKEYKEGFSKAIELFLQSALKNNKLEKSIDLIASKTYNKVSEYLSLEDYRKLLSKIVKSDNLPKFFGTSLKSILSSSENPNFNSASTFNELIKFFFSSSKTNKELSNSINNLFNELLNDDEIKEILVKLIRKYLDKDYSFIFKDIKDQNAIIKKFLNILVQENNEFKLIELLSNETINEIAKNGLNLNFATILNNSIKKFSQSFLNDYDQNITKFIKAFAKNATFDWDDIKTLFKNIFTFIKTKENVISNLLWENIKSSLSDYIDESDFKQLFNYALNDDDLSSLLIDSLINVLSSLSNSDIDSITNIGDILKQIFKEDSFLYNEFPKKIKDFANKFLHKDEVKQILVKIIKKYLNKHYPNISQSLDDAKIKFILDAAIGGIFKLDNKINGIIPSQQWIMRYVSEKGTNFKLNEFIAAFLNQIKVKFVERINNNEVELFKFFNQYPAFKSHKQDIKKLFMSLYENEKIQELLLKEVKDKLLTFLKTSLKDIYTDEEYKYLVEKIFEKKNFEMIFDYLYKIAFDKQYDFSNINSLDKLLELIFLDNENKPSLLVEKIFKNITSDEKIKELIFRLANKYKLLENLTDEEKTKLLDFIPELVKTLDDSEQILLSLFKALLPAILKFDLSKITEALSKWTNDLKDKYLGVDSKENVLKLIKAISKSQAFTNNKALIIKLLKNVYAFIVEKYKFENIIWDKLPQNIKEKVTEATFKSAIFNILNNDKAINFIIDLVYKFMEDIDEYESKDSVQEIIKSFINKEKDYIKEQIKEILNSIVADPTIQSVLTELLKNYAKQYGLDINASHDQLLNSFIRNSFKSIDSLGLYNQTFDTLISSIDEPQNILNNLINMFKSFNFTDIKFLVKILNLDVLKENVDKINALFDHLYTQLINNDLKLNEIDLNKYIEQFLTKLPIKDIDINLIRSIIKNVDSKDLIKEIIKLVLNNADKFVGSERWIDLIHRTFNQDVKPLKDAWIKLIKSIIFERDALFAKQIDTILTNIWKKNPELYNPSVIAKNKDTIWKAIDSFLRAAINQGTLFETIMDNIIEGLKNIPTNTDDQFKELKNTIIKGAIKFITDSNDNEKITLSGILNQGTKIREIFRNIDPDAFINAINYIFEMNIFNLDGGLYSLLFSGVLKEEAKKHLDKIDKFKSRALMTSLRNTELKQPKRQEPSKYEKTKDLNITFKKFSGADLGSLLPQLLSIPLLESVFIPAVRRYLNDVTSKKYEDIKEVKKLNSYKAINRIYTSIMMMAYSKLKENNALQYFWDFRFFLVQANVRTFVSKSIDDVIKHYLDENLKNKLKNLYGNKKSAKQIGIEYYSGWTSSGYQYWSSFFSGYANGNDSHSNAYKNFTDWSDDSILSFIYNYEKFDNKYHNLPNIVLIAKLLKYGYLYKDMDKE
ncbi:GDSL-type esterase/lipase family protein [Metamycoplasma faucium]|uniref:GDSL-type esterase/lipase family protein n=1 Tax=Metamycoplasma faucium TaxID=56142 RepID=A0ABZ2TLB2_9BACT